MSGRIINFGQCAVFAPSPQLNPPPAWDYSDPYVNSRHTAVAKTTMSNVPYFVSYVMPDNTLADGWQMFDGEPSEIAVPYSDSRGLLIKIVANERFAPPIPNKPISGIRIRTKTGIHVESGDVRLYINYPTYGTFPDNNIADWTNPGYYYTHTEDGEFLYPLEQAPTDFYANLMTTAGFYPPSPIIIWLAGKIVDTIIQDITLYYDPTYNPYG